MTGAGSGSSVPTDQPLVWNVSGLLGETAGAVRDYAVQGVTIDLGDDLRLAAPIDGRVHLARTNRGLIVTADFTTKLALQCVRCLRDMEEPIEVEIEEGGHRHAEPDRQRQCSAGEEGHGAGHETVEDGRERMGQADRRDEPHPGVRAGVRRRRARRSSRPGTR